MGAGALRHEVAPGEWRRVRFAWMEAVRVDRDLSMTARLLGHVLALDFANHDTAECRPSPKVIADRLGVSVDTAKRAMADLVAAGWIRRASDGPGRGRAASITFLSRAQVVSLKGGRVAPISGGSNGGKTAPISGPEKGANLRGKGGKFASPPTPPNKDKPYLNHKATDDPDALVRYWAEVIDGGGFIPSGAISRAVAERIVALELIDRQTMKQRGLL